MLRSGDNVAVQGGGDTIRQYRVCIYDSDRAYMISLMNHINSDRENPIFALAFSGADELRAYVSANGADLLVTTEELADRLKGIEVQKMYLTGYRDMADRGDRGDSGDSGVGYVFRYSRAGDIVAAMLRMLDVNERGAKGRLFRLYAVISPVGRCGKTNLALGLCMNDEVRGGLYVGMEEFSAFQDETDVMSNVMYLAKERSEGFIDYVESHVVALEGYSVLGYLRNYMDALELDAEDMAWMTGRLCEWGRFTTIVWDMGQAVLKDLNVLGTFDEVIVPVLGDELSHDKVSAFVRMLEDAELGKVARRLKKVCVPNAAPDSAAMLAFLDKEFDG